MRRRQIPCYKLPNPPPELRNHLKKDTYDKAQAYGKDKIHYQFANTIFSWAQNLLLIKLGVYPWAWDVSARAMAAVGLAQDRVVRYNWP